MSDFRSKRLRNRRIGWAIAALVVIIGAFSFWMMSRGGDDAPEYRTATVSRGDIESVISALGSIQPKFYVDVGAQVSGQLKVLTVEVGDTVTQGELLAEIDPTLLTARVDSSRAQLRQLRAAYQEQQAQLSLARSEAARDQALFESEAISVQQLETSQAALKVAEAKLVQLDAQIEGVESSLSGDEANLNFTRIFAPMTGTVVSIQALEGQTLNANQVTPTILRIADLSVMTVEADVSEADISRVRAAMPAYFNTLGEPDRRWNAEVRQVLPQPEILNDVVLYKALLDVSNENGALLPDMSAQVFFLLGRAQNVIKVPTGALRDGERSGGPGGGQGGERPGGGAGGQTPDADSQSRREDFRALMQENPNAERKIVTVMTDDGPRPRPVLVGLSTRTEAEILAGLDEGDEIVVGVVTPQGQNGPQGGPRRFGR